MDNIVTLETAKALKAAGFPQPEPKEGQIWYGLIQRQEQPLFIIFDGDFFVDRYGNCYGKEAFENWGTFAPTATDILRQLGFSSMLEPISQGWMCTFRGYPYLHKENAAEASAKAFLESAKNGGYLEAETNCPGCMGPCGRCDESDGEGANVATKFGAYLDVNGNAYVGNIKNTTYLHMDMPEKYTRIYNENGGESVTPEDVKSAFENHTPKGSAFYFDSSETKEAFNE